MTKHTPRGASPRLLRGWFAFCPFPHVAGRQDAQQIVADMVSALKPIGAPFTRWVQSCDLSATNDPQAIIEWFGLDLAEVRLPDGALPAPYAAAVWWWVLELGSLRGVALSADTADNWAEFDEAVLAAWPDTGESLPPDFYHVPHSGRHAASAEQSHEGLGRLDPDQIADVVSLWSSLTQADREMWLGIGHRLARS